MSCRGQGVMLFRLADEKVVSNTGEPLALLRVDGKEFVGSLSSYGFPRGFNLAGTLVNDESMRHLPSLLWFADGSIMFRNAGTSPRLHLCKKLPYVQKS